MHPYAPADPPADDSPSIGDFVLASADDVVAYCQTTPVSTWRTYPEFWHLDASGSFRCSSKGSSIDSVQRYAKRPAELLRCREVVLDYPCPNRWVMIDPRHPFDDHYEVTEADAAAFAKLRRWLGRRGVTLVDVVILNQERQWWSLHELTSGTTRWPT